MLMGVFLYASPAPQSVRAVRASFTQLQPLACDMKSLHFCRADSVCVVFLTRHKTLGRHELPDPVFFSLLDNISGRH